MTTALFHDAGLPAQGDYISPPGRPGTGVRQQRGNKLNLHNFGFVKSMIAYRSFRTSTVESDCQIPRLPIIICGHRHIVCRTRLLFFINIKTERPPLTVCLIRKCRIAAVRGDLFASLEATGPPFARRQQCPGRFIQ